MTSGTPTVEERRVAAFGALRDMVEAYANTEAASHYPIDVEAFMRGVVQIEGADDLEAFVEAIHRLLVHASSSAAEDVRQTVRDAISYHRARPARYLGRPAYRAWKDLIHAAKTAADNEE